MLKTMLAATTALTLASMAGAAWTQELTPPQRPVTRPSAQTQAPGPQGGTVLTAGRPVRGQLARGDETLQSGEYTDEFTFTARRGQTYELTLASSAFDPYLLVRGPGGLSEDNDDDPGARGSRDSRIRFTAPADGVVEVSATSYEPGETGAYTLTLGGAAARPATSAAAASDRAIRVGQTLDGRLAPGDRQLDSGEYINSYVLQGRRGQTLDLRLTSTAFDPYLGISGPGDFSAFNDDDPAVDDGRNSRLVVTLPADGAYRITATSYASGEQGAYRLAVLDGAGAATPAPPAVRPSERASADGRIAIGQTVSGSLDAGDDTLESGEYVDHFRFTGRRGQRVAVELTSSAFDAYTILTTPGGDQQDNDDARDGTHDSRLDTVLAEDGEYEVLVTSYAPGETGSYRFSVSPSQGSPRQASVQGGARVFAVMVGVSD
ncbi:MAG TPA: PPC domain-containing protein, partial [Brevundimonas sp.]|nr:PPC domain-containing protein [Brevundimonas sp.]